MKSGPRQSFSTAAAQAEAIREFADTHGYDVSLADPAIHVIFRKKP